MHRLDALEPRPIGLIDPRVRGARLDLAARLYRRLALSKYCCAHMYSSISINSGARCDGAYFYGIHVCGAD